MNTFWGQLILRVFRLELTEPQQHAIRGRRLQCGREKIVAAFQGAALKNLLPASSTSGSRHLFRIPRTCRLLSEWRWWNYHTPAARDREREWDNERATKAGNEVETGRGRGGERAEKHTQIGRGIKDAERQRGTRGKNKLEGIWKSD